MIKIGFLLFLIGIAALWLGAKQSSSELRKIGLGLLVAGVALGIFSLLNVELLPQ